MNRIFVIPFIAIVLFSTAACSESKNQNDNREKKEQNEEKDTTLEAANPMPSPFLGETAQIMIGTKDYDKTVRFYDILGWEETTQSGFGASAKTLTTKATKLESIKSAYWNQNNSENEVLRETLKLQ